MWVRRRGYGTGRMLAEPASSFVDAGVGWRWGCPREPCHFLSLSSDLHPPFRGREMVPKQNERDEINVGKYHRHQGESSPCSYQDEVPRRARMFDEQEKCA
ncbi:hypothetical protein GW17_00020426 [Ensete ventricosum]|nr:hypothetical protein GW17_00020426 [Ensete ventricosum]RZS22106.1 hypothetical protein BHM03_00054842 [Ensete ventricosum]